MKTFKKDNFTAHGTPLRRDIFGASAATLRSWQIIPEVGGRDRSLSLSAVRNTTDQTRARDTQFWAKK